jgi:4-hydroxy-4-methyl-2-oxoglutarate aldolase
MKEELKMKQEIIKYIKTNRVSATEVADCMNKSGLFPGVFPLNRGHFAVGNIFWSYAHASSNWDVHEQVQSVQEDDIVLVEAFDCKDRAIFGHLISKYLILYRQAKGIVVQGVLRDVPHLLKENWPIWCAGASPIGCFKDKPESPLDAQIVAERHKKYMGAIAVCDDSGVVVIPKDIHNEEFLKALEFVEKQEDIWYECIDRRKWSTFDTVCLKKYLHDK